VQCEPCQIDAVNLAQMYGPMVHAVRTTFRTFYPEQADLAFGLSCAA
jgi:hypothetical protein